MIRTIVDRVRGVKTRRSNKWSLVRKLFLNKNPNCAVCSGTIKLEVHHIKPFHLFPELELEESNLITLCEGNKVINCHLVPGHSFNYKKFNPNVIEDAKRLAEIKRGTLCPS
jgi:hypothetical protein